MSAIGAALLLLAHAVSPASAASASPAPTAAAPRVNSSATFVDRAGWMYEGPNGFTMSGPYDGSSESLQLPPPVPPAGGSVVGVEILRHTSGRLEYPVHASLVQKAFAQAKDLKMIYVADGPGSIYRYDLGSAICAEHAVRVQAASPPCSAGIGPIPAAGPIPEAYRAAFAAAQKALAAANLPAAQKKLGNYDVMFVENPAMVWVEFGPHFGATEAPHLGCQTQLGRDMVFGFSKSDLAQNRANATFVQCF